MWILTANIFRAVVDKEKDFPPLPLRNEPQSVAHSRVSSFQSFGSGPGRSGTPRVPPGFERSSTPKAPPGLDNLHAHPEGAHTTVSSALPLNSQARRVSKSTTTPMIPAVPPVVPPVIASHRPISTQPDSNSIDHREDISEVEKAVQDDPSIISKAVSINGSPISKTGGKINESASTGAFSEAKTSETTPKDEVDKHIAAEANASRRKNESSNKTDHTILLRKTSTPVIEANAVNSPGASSSRSATPATSASETKQPRTLRLTTEMIQKAQKSEQASMVPIATEKSGAISAITHIRQESRQPSISTSRPSTPTESERMISQDVSRAGSPPPSLGGSVSSRPKTKSQLKKERREKARKGAEDGDNNAGIPHPQAPATSSTVDPIGPIVARQKKQKNKKSGKIDDGTKSIDSNTEKEAPSTKESPIKYLRKETEHPLPKKASLPEPKPSAGETVEHPEKAEPERVAHPQKKESYTLRDLYNDTSKLQSVEQTSERILQRLLAEHTSPMSKLLSDMISNGDISKDHPLFTPPPFSSSGYKLPLDNRKGQEYLDGNGYSTNDAFGYVYLPQKEKRALFDGHAVSVADNGERKNDLLRRCLITPNGWVMRHLSAEESEKVLDLEERRGLYVEEHGEIGIMNGLGVLEQDDFINLGGGFEELARFGDRHGVCWVVGDRETVDDSQNEDGETGLENDYGLGDMVDEAELLDEGLSDETDEDLDIDFAETVGNMPGGWDPAFSTPHASGPDGLASPLSSMPPNTLPPIQGQHSRNVNLRVMDIETLQKRIHEKHKEADSARKDVEKTEKLFAKKSKDHARWRESIFKSTQEVS